MNAKHQRLVARARAAAARVAVAAAAAGAALAGGVVVTSAASARKLGRPASATISRALLAKLKADVARAQQPPKWYAPGPAVNARKALKGKTIVTFPVSSEIDACNTKGEQGYYDAEARALGAHVDPLQSNTGPAGWQANLSQAVTDKANAVLMLCGVPASAVEPQLAALKAHHAVVVDGNYNQTGGSPAFPTTGLSAESGVNTIQGMQTDLADALVNLNGRPAKILFLDSPQVAQDLGALGGLKAAIKSWCPASCSIVKTENFGTAQWSTPSETSTVASDLQANPSINTVIVAFDGMTDGIESTVAADASSHPGLKMYSWGGGLAEDKVVGTGGTFAADASLAQQWDAYNQLDQTIRLLAGMKPAPVNKEVTPNVFVTKANAHLFSVGGRGTQYSNALFGNGAFVADFLKLWEVKK